MNYLIPITNFANFILNQQFLSLVKNLLLLDLKLKLCH